jgi:tetratricopeptide (TPR) repeat protein
VSLLLTAALNAHRHGGIAPLPARLPRLKALVETHWLATVAGTLGDRLPAERRWADGVALLLSWGLTQLRPDRQAHLGGISDAAWTQSTAWRPMLALSCQHGVLAVPDFPTYYRRRTGEAVADNLCGLWSVGTSTLYRYIDKGRQRLVDVFATSAPDGEVLLSLRSYVDQAWPAPGPELLPAWHADQARLALRRDAYADAIWHQWRSGSAQACIATLRSHSLELASDSEADAILHRLQPGSLPPSLRFELAMAEAQLWRYRRDEAREGDALQRALRIGNELANPSMLGLAYAALGLFDQSRDPERAISRFEASIEQLLAAATAASGDAHRQTMGDYAHSMIHLAWMHLRRNDPKAKPLLAAVERMRNENALPDAACAFLEQGLGEQCRCNGDVVKAIEHRHRSLVIYERLGDRRAITSGYNNLCLLYAQLGELDKATDYAQRVLEASRHAAVEPEVEAGAHGNLAVTYMYAEAFDQAILHLHSALDIHARLGMRRHMVTAHFNLAETHYKRFKQSNQADDERLGDHHAGLAQQMGEALDLHNVVQTTLGLKREILGAGQALDKLVSSEHAAHPRESAEVDRLRNELALPRPAGPRARTHLAIAHQYLLMAAKEREAARALVTKYQVTDDFSAEFDGLRQAWERELSREQQLAGEWRDKLGDLMNDLQRRAVVAHVLAEGSLSKSAYAEVAQVSPATASKHLGLLAERGLLVQTGKGPSTRYLLPT